MREPTLIPTRSGEFYQTAPEERGGVVVSYMWFPCGEVRSNGSYGSWFADVWIARPTPEERIWSLHRGAIAWETYVAARDAARRIASVLLVEREERDLDGRVRLEREGV